MRTEPELIGFTNEVADILTRCGCDVRFTRNGMSILFPHVAGNCQRKALEKIKREKVK